MEAGKNFIVGEMAHVIANAPKGPRGDGIGGNDTYDNLILLCPTHHREIDKAPGGLFPASMLLGWKAKHEAQVSSLGQAEKIETVDDLKRIIGLLLAENHVVWKTLGPRSELAQRSPASNAFSLWELRRLDKIIPNNRRIINIIRANTKLLSNVQGRAFAEFVNHAESYEDHVYNRKDSYPLFPQSFAEAFE